MPALKFKKTATSIKALFVIHKFEVKSLSESAGYLEVARPMIESGLIDDYKITSFGRALDFYHGIIQSKLHSLVLRWHEEPVVIYGAGAHTQEFLKLYQALNVVALSDRDQSLWGTSRFGYKIIPPTEVPSLAKHVLVSSRAYESSILVDLRQLYGASVEVDGLYLNHMDDYYEELCEQLDADIDELDPDVLIYTPTHPSENIRSDFFLRLKQKKPTIKIVNMWWDYDEQAETGSYLDYERDCLKYTDYVIENSNVSRLRKMKQGEAPYQHHEHVEKVHFHPSVFDRSFFCPKSNDLSLQDKPIDLAIWGSSVGKRADWIRFLQQNYKDKFKHFGGVYQGDAPLSTEAYAAAYTQTKIAINTQTYPFRSQCKGKVRETIASGTFLLEEDNEETRAFLPEGRGVIYFSGEADLKQKIDYYLSHPKEREFIAKQGYEWFRDYYHSTYWTSEIFKELGFLHPLDDTVENHAF